MEKTKLRAGLLFNYIDNLRKKNEDGTLSEFSEEEKEQIKMQIEHKKAMGYIQRCVRGGAKTFEIEGRVIIARSLERAKAKFLASASVEELVNLQAKIELTSREKENQLKSPENGHKEEN